MEYSYIEEIPQTIFTDIQEVGSGTFSDIFSAVHISTHTRVALKITFKSNNEEEMKSQEQEVTINKSLNHPFICKYFTDFETEHLKVIVMEIIEGVNALNYVNQTCGLPYQEALNIFTQLLIAIEYLHNEAHITHRDLKLENIMIDKYDHIRLIDFGFSSVNTMMTTCCGSIPYCAPEILSGQKYTSAADIWSLGIILFALINGNLPFYHMNINTLVAIICNDEVKFTQNFQDLAIIDLIKRMLIKDPFQRISIDEIKRHPSLSQQKLLQINYKQLFQTVNDNSISLSSQKSNGIQSVLSKSSIFIKNDNGIQSYHSIKEPSSSDEATSSRHNVKPKSFHENVSQFDEIILSRKDFALKLNKLIESALLNINHLASSFKGTISSNLGSSLGGNRYIIKNRKPQHYVFKNSSPLLKPNVNNCKILGKNLFDKK